MAKDFSKLTGLIYEKYGSQAAFCEAIGKSADWISRRLNNKVQFNGNDMILVCEALGIDAREINTYFLTPNVL